MKLLNYICKGVKWACMGYMIIVLFILIFQQVGLINLLDRTIDILYWIMLFVWFIGIMINMILRKLINKLRVKGGMAI